MKAEREKAVSALPDYRGVNIPSETKNDDGSVTLTIRRCDRMQREIKFRQAIFVKGKFDRWHYWGFIKQYGQLTFVGPETNSSTIEDALKKSQQYTGKWDSDGTEIYDGDLVSSRSGFIKATLVVYWDDGSLQYRLCSFGDRQFDKTHDLKRAVQVIGNIHEHPDQTKEAPE